MNNTVNEIARPWEVPDKAICLLLNDWEYSIWAFCANDGKQSKYGFQWADNNGVPSEPIYKGKSQLLDKNSFRFVLDFSTSFDTADSDEVKTSFWGNIRNLEPIDDMARSSLNVVYQFLCSYAKKYPQEDVVTITEENPDCKYANIETETFAQIISDGGFGWKALEVKRRLKQLQLLRINSGRPYDWALTNKDGNTYRTISLKYSAKEAASID